eukprot:CAMPEP_0201939264 /NCGR_PEP_ID=MMETSP0903-20130614/42875_1 /ASSEMBLY_ACC=CAM_ASM_000552 /TAXON_ID=420261 /ORGANISM="Thalassiosira antarctica, Strain CCMP982" /LENGTH=228 /DNA_ID=CAMNT_0048480747 /DNA_START=331 /DNA_END=1014 /DNA_ORIENTATION=-
MTTNISEGGGVAVAGVAASINGAGGPVGGTGGSEIIDSKPLISTEASLSSIGEAESNSSGGNNDNNLSHEKSGNGQPIPNDTNSQQQKQQQQESGALEKNSRPAAAAELADKNNLPNNSDQLEGRQLAVIDSRQLAVIDGPLAKVMPDEGSIAGGTGVSSRTPSVMMEDRSHTPNSSMDSSLGLEGRQLTVIDGPLAKGTPDGGSIAGGTIPSVMEDHRGHTPNSSMD